MILYFYFITFTKNKMIKYNVHTPEIPHIIIFLVYSYALTQEKELQRHVLLPDALRNFWYHREMLQQTSRDPKNFNALQSD